MFHVEHFPGFALSVDDSVPIAASRMVVVVN